MSLPILSISSRRNSGLRTPTLVIFWIRRPGMEPIRCTTVTADLGLVTHAAERHAHELAIGGAGDGFGQGGLAHAGRSHQATDRASELLHPLLHGEILENALLDLFQAIMVGIEDVFRLGEIMAHLALGLPRHVQQPVYVGTHHGGFPPTSATSA